MVKHIAFTVYPVTDMARARRFYDKAAVPAADSGQIAFEVDDVDAVVRRLRERGATVKVEPFSGSVCRMAEVLDPEGNALCIHAKHPGRAPDRRDPGGGE